MRGERARRVGLLHEVRKPAGGTGGVASPGAQAAEAAGKGGPNRKAVAIAVIAVAAVVVAGVALVRLLALPGDGASDGEQAQEQQAIPGDSFFLGKWQLGELAVGDKMTDWFQENTLELLPDGTAVMVDAGEETRGTWRQTGESATMTIGDRTFALENYQDKYMSAEYGDTLMLYVPVGVTEAGGATQARGVAAEVDGVAIYEDEVTQDIQKIRRETDLESADDWKQFLADNDMTPESVRGQVIGSLVDQELVKEGAKDLGIHVGSSEVDEYVASMRAKFDSDDDWQENLREAGFTEESYRREIEASLLQQAVGGHFEDDVNVEDSDVLEAARTYAPYYDGAKRSSHILMGVDDPEDEAAMRAARERAASIRARIVAGEITFADAAKQYSDDAGSAEQGGDVGWDASASFVTEYQDALKDLKVGQISEPVDSAFGVHIITVTGEFTAPAEVTSLNQIPKDFLPTLQDMAVSMKANGNYTAWLDDLRENADIVIRDMPAGLPYAL